MYCFIGIWKGTFTCGIAITVWFSTRFLSFDSNESIFSLHIIGAILCFLYFCMLIDLIFCPVNNCCKCCKCCCIDFCSLKPSEWQFIIASMLTIVYQLILVFYEGTEFWSIYLFVAVVCALQIVVKINLKNLDKLEIQDKRRYRIGAIIIFNILFMIFIISHDLAEQLELEKELAENEHIEHEGIELFVEGIFFANLEHVWGMMEACQEIMSDDHHHHSDTSTQLK